MSSSTCNTTTCAPCSPYDNCGCLNPTTFDCITGPPECESLGITADMTGTQALTAACESIDAIVAAQGKVVIDSNDTCPPRYIWDILEEGLNISFTRTGSGCDQKIVVNAVEGGTPIDIYAKISANDTTSGYLYDKISGGTFIAKSILNAGANEVLKLEIVPSALISTDSGNQLTLGIDGKLKTAYSVPDGSETKVVQGTGTTVSGTGTIANPYVVSINPSISVARPCFDGVWRGVTIVPTGNANVVFVSGSPQYRYRFDGTLEFRGSITHTVAFGPYSTANRKFTFTMGNIPTTCLSLAEQIGTADIKGINYIDQPQAGVDQIVQQYGYVIRKSAQNIILEFQSSFTNATSKTVVVNFDGVVSHPQI